MTVAAMVVLKNLLFLSLMQGWDTMSVFSIVKQGCNKIIKIWRI